MKALGWILLALTFTGCAAKQEYYDLANSYKGQSVDKLVEDQGPPHQQFQKKDGSQVLKYTHKPGIFKNGISCSSTFESDKAGIIQKVTIEDNGACRAQS